MTKKNTPTLISGHPHPFHRSVNWGANNVAWCRKHDKHGVCHKCEAEKAVSPTPTNPQIESGHVVTFDGGTWGMVEEVVGTTIWVTDEDGGEHELTAARID